MYEYSATVLSVHDGDTMTVDVDLGFGIHAVHKLRLANVNAPELDTAAGKDALAWVKQWVATNPGPYILRTKKGRETEKYGRYIGTLISPSQRILNLDLLAAGQAVSYNP